MNAPLWHIDPAALARAFVSKRVPRAEAWRTHFGRNLTPARIESAILAAADGFLQDLTDAGAETILVDPHLASTLRKRFGAIAQCDWDLTPAQGDDINKQTAADIASMVRSQLEQLPAFRQAIEDLAWGVWNGRAALENHWDRRFTGRAKYQIAELGWIHPRRLTFGPERELRVIDPVQYTGQFQPVGLDTRVPCKFVRCVPRLFAEYPERDGLLPRCLYWSNFKRFSARERMVLIELYAKPWRVVQEDPAFSGTVDPALVNEAVDQADALGGVAVAKFAKGLKLEVINLDPKSGDLHNHTIEDCDKQISKIVLGSTGTMDAQPQGIGGQQARVNQDDQYLIFQSDGERISGVLQRDLVNAIVLLNAPFYGISTLDALRYAPRFNLRTAPEKDRKAELANIKSIVDLGLPVAVDEIRERTGFRKPSDDEAIVQIVEAPQDDMSARYIPPRAMVIDPTGTEPGIGEYGGAGAQPPPAPRKPDGSTPVTDGVAPAAPAAPAALEPGSPDEDFDLFSGPLGPTLAEIADLATPEPADGLTNFPVVGENRRVSLINSRFKVFPASVARQLRDEYPQIWSKGGTPLANLQFRKLAPIVDRRGVVETDAEEEAVRLREAWAARHVDDSDVGGVVAQIKWLVVGAQGYDRMLRVIGLEKARVREVAPAPAAPTATATARHLTTQPGYVNGTTEDISDARTRRGAAITQRWARALSRAAAGHETAADIRTALRAAAKALNVREFATEIERCMLHAAALGALDADWEATNEEPIAPAKFAASPESLRLAGGQRGFATTPFWEAINAFLSREVVEPSIWDRLTGNAKKRAFSIAKEARKEVLNTAFDELGKSITEGWSLRTFRKRLNERYDSAGWTRLKPSHVEVIFRNATMGAYSSGREVQMTQPAVLAARPYWQILSVRDDRCRATHARVRGFVLRADDPFWRKAGRPPWGHNCFLPQTIMSGAMVGASRALYTGKAVEIVTHEGRRLSVTANHPILTAQGFASAQSIRVGDDLVCYQSEAGVDALGSGPKRDECHEPASAEKVFGALSKLFKSGRIRCVGSDFHGEAQRFTGDVEVVGSYRKLPHDGQPSVDEERGEFVLEQPASAGHGKRDRGALTIGSDATSGGAPGPSALALDGSAVGLQGDPLVAVRFGSVAQRDSALAECVTNGLSGDSEIVGKLLERGAGSVSLDKVVEVREFDYSGHVYDFESEPGWVVADGIVASNCRCRLVSRSEREIKRLGLTVRRGSEISGLPDPGWSSSKSALI